VTHYFEAEGWVPAVAFNAPGAVGGAARRLLAWKSLPSAARPDVDWLAASVRDHRLRVSPRYDFDRPAALSPQRRSRLPFAIMRDRGDEFAHFVMAITSD
jgi:hypothetical protein